MRKKSTSKVTTLSKNWRYRSLSVPDKMTASMTVLLSDDDITMQARATILLCSAIVYKDVAVDVLFFLQDNKQKLHPVFVECLQNTAHRVLALPR